MSTAGTEGTSLEDLLLAVLQSGTPLADGLRREVTKLMHWLTDESASESADAPPATELLNALIRLRQLGNSQAPGPTPGREDESTTEDPTDLDASGTAGPVNEVTDTEGTRVDGDPAGAETVPAPEAGDKTGEASKASLDPAKATVEDLRTLWDDLRKWSVAGQYRSVYGDPPETIAAAAIDWLWTRLFLTCLRLPGEQAERIRERAETAVDGYPDREQLPPLAPGELPPLVLGEVPSEAESEIGKLQDLEPGLGKWPGLAHDIIWSAWLAWHDDGVKCAYRPANTQGIAVFDEQLRRGFTANMTDKLNSLLEVADSEPRHVAERLVLVDEALRGIVPIPLPQPGSWWTVRLERSDRRLKSQEYRDAITVLDLDLNSLENWDDNFDKADVVTIKPEEAAGDYAGTFNRVWILRYPVKNPHTGALKKGRYVAVRY